MAATGDWMESLILHWHTAESRREREMAEIEHKRHRAMRARENAASAERSRLHWEEFNDHFRRLREEAAERLRLLERM